jgi:hypothetical protein
MKLWRCQFGEANSPDDFRIDESGACGTGIYAMKAGDKKLRKYYSERGENTYEFEVPDHLVKKIGGVGKTYYQAIKEAIEMEREKGQYKVFICKHEGINIPKSKQIVIIDRSVIRDIKKL